MSHIFTEDWACKEHPRYKAALDILTHARRYGIDPSLEESMALCTALGKVHQGIPALQIAGTNGKTSTSRFCAALLNAAGLCTELYTSPELVEYRERIEIGGKLVSYDDFGLCVTTAQQAAQQSHKDEAVQIQQPTEFELLTAGALWLGHHKKVDAQVLEVGLGGRWDSTNVVDARVAVVTGIGFDHCKILGNTIEQIAYEKIGIVKQSSRVVFSHKLCTNTLAYNVCHDYCVRLGVHPFTIQHLEIHENSAPDALYTVCFQGPYGFHELHFNVRARYQLENIATAVCAVELFLDCSLDDVCIEQALEYCPTPGRFEVLQTSPLLLIDAAHNPESIEVLLHECMQHNLKERYQNLTCVCACFADKNTKHMATLLAQYFDRIICTQTNHSRALAAHDLAEIFKGCTYSAGKDISICTHAADVLSTYAHENLVACGSISLAGTLKHSFADTNHMSL